MIRHYLPDCRRLALKASVSRHSSRILSSSAGNDGDAGISLAKSVVALAGIFKGRRKGGIARGREKMSERVNLVKRLIHVRKLARVTSGGKKRSVWALIIVGDENGSAGFGEGRALDPQGAIAKATQNAIKDMTKIPRLDNRTVFTDYDHKVSLAGALFTSWVASSKALI